MNVLLDTHAFIWWIQDNPRLSDTARNIISDAGNTILLSTASFWEMSIKIQLGKLSLADNSLKFIENQVVINNFEHLPISIAHTWSLQQLPVHHKDPFDRMLITQSRQNELPIITCDPAFDSYAVDCIW